MKQDRIRWSPVLRRSGALLAGGAALLALTFAGGSAAIGAVGEDPAFLTAALSAELGPAAEAPGPMKDMDFWQRLLLRQSVYLQQLPSQLPPQPQSPADPPEEPVPAAPPSEEQEDKYSVPTAPSENIVAQTLVPASSGGYLCADGLYLRNRTDLTVDFPAALSAGVPFTLSGEGPEILIIHTHTTEAYTPCGSDTYVPTDSNARTLDQEQSVVRVGEEMASVFREMGLSVLHDTQVYDYPRYNGSYSRSGAAVESLLAANPSIRLVLDVHRDALVGEDGTVYKTMTHVDGAESAQVMLVVGTGKSHPDWMHNLALAGRIQKSLDTLYPTLARPMVLRSSVYNQDLSPGSLLVEVGSHGNTLQEAITAARHFARAAGQVYLGLRDSGG